MFVTLKDELAIDKQNVALENMLENKGLIKHIADAFSENNIYYAHNAQNIASGFFTSELAVTIHEVGERLAGVVNRLNAFLVFASLDLRAKEAQSSAFHAFADAQNSFYTNEAPGAQKKMLP